jgi:general secretion pathway protein B
MSYILDALIKSDQQRKRGATPTLDSSMHATPVPTTQTVPVRYGLFALILVGAGILIEWWRPWQPMGTATAPLVAHPAASPAALAPVPTALVLTPDAPPLKSAQPAAEHGTRERHPAVAKQKSVPAASVPAVAVGAAAARSEIRAISELPVPLQQELSQLTISVHAYSARPHDRIVGINDRVLHEGGSLPSGLTVEQITPQGMILNYKGYRFRRNLDN